MVKNVFFLDSEHIGMGGNALLKKNYYFSWVGGGQKQEVQVGESPPQFPPKEYPFVNLQIILFDTKCS